MTTPRWLNAAGTVVSCALLVAAFTGCSDETTENVENITNNTTTVMQTDANATPETRRNVILMIADGSQVEHETAYSRYLKGVDNAVAGRQFEYLGWNTTWDVTTYNNWAAYGGTEGEPLSAAPMTWAADPGAPWAGADPFVEADFDTTYGYDPALGGNAPYPIDEDADGNVVENYTASPKPGIWTADAMTDRNAHYPATDSASAGTAMSCGKKTDKGNIAWESGDPDGGAIDTIAELARAQRGMAIGVVSSVEWSHATPASFVSHAVSRGNYADIAREILSEVQPDVVIGAGDPALASPKYSGGDVDGGDTPWFDDFAANTTAYEVVRWSDGVDGGEAILAAAERVVANIAAGSGPTKLVGCFGSVWEESDFDDAYKAQPSGYTQYSSDPNLKAWQTLVGNSGKHMNTYMPRDGGFVQVETENPTLADATKAALEVLSQDEDGFFLMVEGGDIDWANHANDYEWMLGAWHNFDLACQQVVEFIDQEDDDVTWDNTMVIIATDHGNSYMRLKKYYGKGVLPPTNERQICQLAPPASVGVKYSSNDHTNELVTLYAHGGDVDLLRKYEGDWYAGKRIIDNTHIFFAMAEWLRVDPGYFPMSPVPGGGG
ncbi:MAG: alkaline phosphatase [Planctomycetota bacterium]